MANCLYVAPNGDDKAKGTIDAPFKTLQAALKCVETLGESCWDGEITVCLRGGVYPIDKTVSISVTAPVTVRSFDGEQAIFDGGRVISGFEEGALNGLRCWTARLEDGEYFNSLFVNGARRTRAFLPKKDYYYIEDVPGQPLDLPFNVPGDRFIVKEGDFKPTRNLRDVQVHVFHYWSDELMPVLSYDPETRLLISDHPSHYTLHDDRKKHYAKYRIENLFEGLTEPGDWYIDRAEKTLYYLPMDGETIENTEVVAPVCEQAFDIHDSRDLTIDNVTIRHFDWAVHEVSVQGQGSTQAGGAVTFARCHRCALTNSVIEHVGYYAIDVREGCSVIKLCGNVLRDMGAGGVKINGTDAKGAVAGRTHHIRVCDNLITEGGRQFLAGIGVISMHAHHVTIAHNVIHDLYYSGVSCGWVWGYAESVSHDNIIEYNHIYDIGHFVLSDMGGIYMLGVQPGSIIRYNLIHDIEKANYGGWAIYPDEGSSHLLIENNIGYNTTSSCFHQHYGRENVVRNNIWAFGSEGVIAYTRLEEHVGFTFERNIVLTDDQPLFTGFGMAGIKSDMNVYWDIHGRPLEYAPDLWNRETRVPMDSLKKQGYDLFTVVADPLLKDPAHGDFTLDPASPALKMGFVPIDMTGLGVREGRGKDFENQSEE